MITHFQYTGKPETLVQDIIQYFQLNEPSKSQFYYKSIYCGNLKSFEDLQDAKKWGIVIDKVYTNQAAILKEESVNYGVIQFVVEEVLLIEVNKYFKYKNTQDSLKLLKKLYHQAQSDIQFDFDLTYHDKLKQLQKLINQFICLLKEVYIQHNV